LSRTTQDPSPADPVPPVDGAAHRRPGRSTVTAIPHNAETELDVLQDELTPISAFYVRSNFPTPILDSDSWTVEAAAEGRPSLSLSLSDLRDVAPEETRLVTLECAGNGRTLLNPSVPGTGWTLGATGTAAFTGVPLWAVLERFRPPQSAVEVLFTGADEGEKDDWGKVSFQRSLPLEAATAVEEGPLLAWAMNGEALRPDHGAPVRLVVPGWYAVASVKWLTGIRYLDRPFHGCFQTDRYRYIRPGEEPRPVTRMRVRSLILDPADGGRLRPGSLTISGSAWSGRGPIVGVRVSTDAGSTWRDARVEPAPAPFTPSRWSIPWDAEAGEHQLVARARDAAGNEQPLTQWWNELGYGNNQVHRVRVVVSG